MGYSYNAEFRAKLINFIKEGHTQKQACVAFGVHITTVGRWYAKDTKRPAKSYPHRKPREHRKIDPVVLKEHMKANPNARLIDIARYFDCSEGSVSRTVKQCGIKRKNQNKKIDPIKLKAYVAKYPNKTNGEIGKRFGCTDSAVGFACKRFGIPRNRKRK